MTNKYCAVLDRAKLLKRLAPALFIGLGLVASAGCSGVTNEQAACNLAESLAHPQPVSGTVGQVFAYSIEPIRKVEDSTDRAIAEAARNWVAAAYSRYPPGGVNRAEAAMLSLCQRRGL